MSQKGKELIRDMAKKYRDIALSDQMQSKVKRWKDTVSDKGADRKPVLLRIFRSRNEIFPEAPINRDPFLIDIEKKLNWDIFCSTLGDDTCLFPYYENPAVIDQQNPPRYGLEILKEEPSEPGGAWKSIPPLTSESDLEKLAIPRWHFNEKQTNENRERLEDLIGDIIPIKPTGNAPFTATFDEVAETLMGFNDLLLNVALKPDMIHRLMSYMRDQALSTIDQIEAMGILSENNDYHKYNSYSIKKDPHSPVSTRDQWIWTNSQVFGSVGPDHFNEFLLNYQKPIFERFGAVSYGCCEDLTQKIDSILTIPNLKIFVSSYWTKLEEIAPKCAEKDLCIEWRQLASDMMGQPDWNAWKKHLKPGLELTANQRMSIVLQEVETVEGNVDKFRSWCQMAVRLSEELS